MSQLSLVARAALIVAYALGPLATQMVTPAVPFVHDDLGIPMATAQALVSLAFVTIALATLVYGPLADRVGRRAVMLTGTALFCLGSLLASIAPSAPALLAGRAVQAAGSAAALSLTRTVIHDVYGRERSARALAQLTTVMIFVPMLAPVLGGVLLDRLSWRAVFAVCLAGGSLALLLLARHLPETRPSALPAASPREVVAHYGALLADPAYRAPALHFAWIMAAVFATQAAIPYLLVEVLGGTATEYGLWFGVGCLCYVAGNQFTARWGDRFERRRLIQVSGLGCLGAALLAIVACGLAGLGTVTLFGPTLVLYFFAAVGIAPVQAEAVAAQPARAGAASGLLTAVQMAVGALTVQGIGLAHDGTARPLLGGLLVCTLAAVALYARVPPVRGWLRRSVAAVRTPAASRPR